MEDTRRTLEAAAFIGVPFIVMGELRAGFASGHRGEANEQQLQAFIQAPGIEILLADDDTTRHYGRLFAQARRQGTMVPTNDLWIAALAIQYDLTLFSRDRHFERFSQLRRV